MVKEAENCSPGQYKNLHWMVHVYITHGYNFILTLRYIDH